MPIEEGSRLYYEEHGASNAHTIVFLHGGGAGGWMWKRQVQALASKYHCLVPDLPEQGETIQVSSEPYTTESAADRIAELIHNQAHSSRAHIVGLSEGAQVLVALLSRSPQFINHAMVSSAILRPMWLDKFYSRGLLQLSYRWFLKPFKNYDGWIRLNMKYSAGITDEYFDDFKKNFQRTTESSLTNMMLSSLHFRLPQGLERADLPVLVVVGSKEYKEMIQSARDLVTALPQARGAMVSLGSKSSLAQEHNWAITAPELFTATLKAWIEDLPLPGQLLPLN